MNFATLRLFIPAAISVKTVLQLTLLISYDNSNEAKKTVQTKVMKVNLSKIYSDSSQHNFIKKETSINRKGLTLKK